MAFKWFILNFAIYGAGNNAQEAARKEKKAQVIIITRAFYNKSRQSRQSRQS